MTVYIVYDDYKMLDIFKDKKSANAYAKKYAKKLGYTYYRPAAVWEDNGDAYIMVVEHLVKSKQE